MKVLVVTGASGGHIFPALGFIDTLKNRDKEIEALLVLPRSCLKLAANRALHLVYKVNYISICPVKLSIGLKNIIAVFNFLKGSLESLFIILKFRPDIVVGFGSLTSIAMVMLAWLCRIKTLIHEQNVLPGRANRLLVKFTDRIAISFPDTKDYLRISQDKIVFTGNPVRKGLRRINKEEAFGFFGFSPDKFTVLAMGGSLGSHRINKSFFGAVSTIADKSGFQVIHISGPGDYALLYNSYKDLGLEFKLFAFLEQMHYAYSICDLAVSRGGATTIAELINFGLPAIIVPYPYAYSHQHSNARVLEKKGCAIVIKDSQLDADTLRETLDGIMHNPDKIRLMRSRYEEFIKVNANDLLVDAALSLG